MYVCLSDEIMISERKVPWYSQKHPASPDGNNDDGERCRSSQVGGELGRRRGEEMSAVHNAEEGRRGSSLRHSNNIFHRHELTRTATPITSVGQALGNININPKLHNGIPCYKVCRNGALVERVITLSRSNFIVFVTPRRVWDTAGSTHAQHNLSSPFKGRMRRRTKKASSNTTPGASDDGSKTEAASTQAQSKSHRSPRYLDICDITNIVAGGITSRKLELCRAKYLGKRQLLSITSLTRNWYKISKAAELVTNRGGDSIVTIAYGAYRDTLDLIIPDERDKDLILNSLRSIMLTYEEATENVPNDELLLRYIWHDLDKGKTGKLNKRELWNACRRMNFYKTKREFNATFKTYDEKRRAVLEDSRWKLLRHHTGLDFRECLAFLRAHKTRSGAWVNTFGQDVESVSAEEFLSKFLHDKQREFDATLADASNIIAQLHSTTIGNSPFKTREDENKGERNRMNRALFDVYLHSPSNGAHDPRRLRFDQSCMDKSLSEYYINSSHNTYLLGDQLKSTSSVEAYSAALQRGCKCLEIDCWSGDGDSIVVYHGYTLTTRIDFADVVQCIGQYLDEHPNTFPIILSLEVHCSLAAQRQMAALLEKVFGERLYVPKEEDTVTCLPSPNALRGMVVIKGKRPQSPSEALGSTSFSDDTSIGERAIDPYDQVLEDSSLLACNSRDSGPLNNAAEASKIDPELARITLFHGCAFHNFERSLQSSPSHMHSMNEAALSKILSRSPAGTLLWKQYNRSHITRIYPNGSRVDSSNFSPLLSWTLGCQMVSLNFQTTDSPLIINDGLFCQNGGCGYVLKSDELRDVHGTLSTQSTSTKTMRTIRIRVVSGSCLPKPDGKPKGECIDPYVRVRIHDVIQASNANITKSGVAESNGRYGASSLLPRASSPIHQLTTTHTTRYVLDNGYSPVWKDNSWAEFKVYNDLAMVQFSVLDSDYVADDRIGESAILVKSVRPGYRCVSLYDKSGSRSGPYGMASLLVEFDFPSDTPR